MITSIENSTGSVGFDAQKMMEELRLEREAKNAELGLKSKGEFDLSDETLDQIEKINQNVQAVIANISLMQMQASTSSVMDQMAGYNNKGESKSQIASNAAGELPSFEEAAFMMGLGQSFVTMNDMTQSHEEVMEHSVEQKEEVAQEAVSDNLDDIKKDTEKVQEEVREGNGTFDKIEEVQAQQGTEQVNPNGTVSANPRPEVSTAEKVDTEIEVEPIEFESVEEFKESFTEPKSDVGKPPANADSVDVYV